MEYFPNVLQKKKERLVDSPGNRYIHGHLILMKRGLRSKSGRYRSNHRPGQLVDRYKIHWSGNASASSFPEQWPPSDIKTSPTTDVGAVVMENEARRVGRFINEDVSLSVRPRGYRLAGG